MNQPLRRQIPLGHRLAVSCLVAHVYPLAFDERITKEPEPLAGHRPKRS